MKKSDTQRTAVEAVAREIGLHHSAADREHIVTILRRFEREVRAEERKRLEEDYASFTANHQCGACQGGRCADCSGWCFCAECGGDPDNGGDDE